MKQHKFLGLFIASLLLFFVLLACEWPDEGDDPPQDGSAPTSTSAVPALGSTIYDAATGKLTIVGSNLPTTIAGWDFTKLKIVGHDNKAGLALNAHTAAATDSTTGSAPSANTLAITFKGNHKDAVDHVLNKNGLTASDNNVYNLKAEAGTFTNSAKTTDLKNAILVANWPDINITSATYNATTGQLVISGSNLPAEISDWDFTKLKIQGTKTPATDITLSAHDTGSNAYQGSAASASSLTITAKGSKKKILEAVLDTNGTYGSDLKVYNLRMEEGAFTKLPAIADESGNAITVRNYNKTAPTITSIEYDASIGLLRIEGRNYEDIGTWDFTKLKITGKGGAPNSIYLNTLPTSTNDLTTTILSPLGATMFVFFKGTHKTAIDALLDKDGKTASDATLYNLAAETGTWRNSPSTTVTTAAINVSMVP